MRSIWVFLLCLIGLAALATGYRFRNHLPYELSEPLGLRGNISDIRARVLPGLTEDLAAQGLQVGAPLYLRIFKEEAELELWVQKGRRYQRYKTYPICTYSGALGPKLQEGDGQSPEGFYTVDLAALNPRSSYHLSFNLGFPNTYDRGHGRTGSFLMVHGDCVSIGCYAMTDPLIEEIYLLVEAALRNGQAAVPAHAFPFRMTPSRMAEAEGHQWQDFWQQLQPAYLQFEETIVPPAVSVEQGRYIVDP